MEKKGWKILSVILIIILVVENLFMIWGIILIKQENENTMECYYEICEGYPEALYDNDYSLCYCYDYDVLGNLIIVESEYMK